MLNIIAAHPLPFIIAVLIGIVTAWWIWGRAQAVDTDTGEAEYTDAEPAADPVVAPVAAAPTPAAPVGAMGAAAAAAATPAASPVKPLKVSEVEDGKPKIRAAVGEADDLTRIKGIGPKLNDLCLSLGVKRFDQIADWNAEEVAEVDGYLKNFKGRIARDQWVAQAKLLANGKDEAHKREFGA